MHIWYSQSIGNNYQKRSWVLKPPTPTVQLSFHKNGSLICSVYLNCGFVSAFQFPCFYELFDLSTLIEHILIRLELLLPFWLSVLLYLILVILNSHSTAFPYTGQFSRTPFDFILFLLLHVAFVIFLVVSLGITLACHLKRMFKLTLLWVQQYMQWCSSVQ